ncbi:MAG: uracil-DNA glycosylase [Tenacibaculum sp.]
MELNIADSWKCVLKEELKKDYFAQLIFFVNQEYKKYTCYPDKKVIFAAFSHCAFDSVKVVILGQDPYYRKGQANGLCFAVNNKIAHPPSLVNIFKEVKADTGTLNSTSANLLGWAKQGVLLLNAVLTVREGKAGSHSGIGWEKFTDAVIKIISEQKKNIVFLFWGEYAKRKGAKIDRKKHCVLTSGHPSPLSANRGLWFGNKHFSKTNSFLKANNLTTILW